MHSVGIDLHEVFGALADPTRIRIVRLLLETNEEACLCELSDSLEEPEYKLSRHLKVLKSSGLITSVREGKWVYHGLVNEMVYLKAIHKAVKTFPDDSKGSIKDLAKFKKRIGLREDGRCKTGIQRTENSGKSVLA
jgi:ArsR family transcriptional regulator, arsenate/arsenite/antimonite-responsive transcriptional repressor